MVERSRPKRIILFSMDTVRADRMSGYGSTAITPSLKQIAAEGVLIRVFYTSSTWTLPSHIPIFSGLDTEEHGLSDMAARIGL
ncbi:sulfatase-like hydrolase/transferase [bacterium]|nr:sulfatase-like hydrolase/transferase [bacterium]